MGNWQKGEAGNEQACGQPSPGRGRQDPDLWADPNLHPLPGALIQPLGVALPILAAQLQVAPSRPLHIN